MSYHPREYAEAAREFRRSGDLILAGGYYTASSHARFARSWSFLTDDLKNDPREEISPSEIGYGVESLLAAALCYRLAGEMDRCRTRCEQGIRLIDDINENEPGWFEGMGLDEGKSNARSGLAHELIGDFRLYGDLGGHEEEYATARREYETVRAEYPVEAPETVWQAEPEFAPTVSILIELARSTDYGLDEETATQIRDRSLVDRIEYKSDHYEAIIEEVLADGNWESDVI